ncbi:MAG: alpha/beta hydrolase fold domain-containing protein [Kiritimatiellae bacterium]|nr:alpha/beta hydrolase fold domain-containing protein [Kiritimatiellia bacterium]
MKFKAQRAIALAAILYSSFFILHSYADRQYVWPEGKMPDAQPHQIAAMTDVSNKEDFNADEWRRPYLDWFAAPENPNGACMILISGGSYKNCCDVGLICYWREKLTSLGFQCVNFVYRTPWPENLPIYQTAWEDGQRAVRLVRAEAAKRGFDPQKIGVVSMSAGSHLATLLATSSMTSAYAPVDELDATPCNVNWACVFAPAFVQTDGYGKPNTRRGMVDAKLDTCFKFDAQTCPMCLMHGGNDNYSPVASTLIYRELRKRKIPAEVHIVPDKGHGAHGFDRAVEFMRQMGYLGPLGEEVDLLGRWNSDDDRAIYAKEDVWPAGKMPDAQEHQTTPYIEWHIPSNLTTKAIQIIWSGGAYNNSNPNRYEVAPLRRYLNAKGMAVVTLDYRHPRPKNLAKHVTAWEDAQRTIRIVKSQAAARGLDPNRIGIMGSSAGGHLALLCASTSKTNAYWPIDDIDRIKPNVQWAICIYPAYSLTDGLEKQNAKGGNEDDAVLAPEFAFDLSTPPMLFLHGDSDGWAAMNSVKAWEKLRFMGIQGELHTLVKRGHCFHNKASPDTASYNWMERVWDFLNAKGFLKD